LIRVRGKLGGTLQGLVVPSAGLVIIDEGVPPDVEELVAIEAAAVLSRQWHLAPHADVPRPQLRVIEGGRMDSLTDVS
jgi:hypothetical protein